MKTRKDLLILSLLFILVIISGCIQGTTEIVTSQASITSTNSVVPIQTKTLTSTPSLTPVPTLSTDNARMRLLELLATNGNCKLPCIWGIVPMKSSFQEAQTALIPFSILSGSVNLDPPAPISIFPRYVKDNLEIYTAITVLTNSENDFVSRISLNIEAYRLLLESGTYNRVEYVYDSSFFNEAVSAYMLPHILSEQGIPESVMIYTSGGPLTRGGTGGFEIVLFYPNQGIFVHYKTQMYIIGKNVQGCFQSPLVWMELFPSGDTDNFFTELEKTKWPYFKNGFKHLEETTSMSMDEFYETFREPTDKCLETLAELWPIPEP